MNQGISMKSARDFQSAFRVEPEVGREAMPAAIGIYRWSTPRMDGFELPGCDDLVIAMHIGGSRQVRALTEWGPSRSRSAPGLLTILPAGRPAAFLTEGSVRLVSLHVSRNALAADWPESPRFAFRDAYAGAAMEALLRATADPRGANPDYIGRIADALLCHLACFGRGYGKPAGVALPGGADPIARVLALIDRHIGDSLDLEALAAAAGLSRATLVRRLRQATGLSPHQYLTTRRIETAKTLLRDSSLGLSGIAQDTGFSSQSHFTAIFRHATGVTPGEFRRRH